MYWLTENKTNSMPVCASASVNVVRVRLHDTATSPAPDGLQWRRRATGIEPIDKWTLYNNIVIKRSYCWLWVPSAVLMPSMALAPTPLTCEWSHRNQWNLFLARHGNGTVSCKRCVRDPNRILRRRNKMNQQFSGKHLHILPRNDKSLIRPKSIPRILHLLKTGVVRHYPSKVQVLSSENPCSFCTQIR